MEDFHKHYKKAVMITTVIMLITVGLWIFYRHPVFAGFAAGTMVSIVNTNILYRGVLRLTEKSNESSLGLTNLTGMSWRALLVILIVLFADRVDNFNVYATVVGAFAGQIVAYIYFFVQAVTTQD